MLQLVLGANTGSVFTQTLLGAFWCRLFAYLFAQFPALQLVLGTSGGTPRGRVARGAPLPASRRPPLARRI